MVVLMPTTMLASKLRVYHIVLTTFVATNHQVRKCVFIMREFCTVSNTVITHLTQYVSQRLMNL